MKITQLLISLYCIILSSSLLPRSNSDLVADQAALITLRTSVGGRTYFCNDTEQSPCSWVGVKCELNRVTVLRLPGVALSGELPAGVFTNLTPLRTLSLRLNALSCKLPPDLTRCTRLWNLYLQGNEFSGEIPNFLFSLRGLVRLNLADNNFTAQFPTRFDNLTRLKTLFVENNRLSGSIPGLKFGELEQVNVSNNLLNGSIPQRL
ncbi:Probable inactive receptor kinase At1g48480 [Linum perenne]